MLINDEVFKLNWDDIPKMPVELSDESLKFWKEQKRRCIEGYWCCGKYMPGPLYFYINFWQILLNKDRRSKAKSLGRPELWDIHWPISYGLMEARGFSGFEKTPLALDLKKAIEADDYELEKKIKAQMGKPRDFCKDTVEDLGKALYLNQAKNYMWFGNRGHGKDLHEDTLLWYEGEEKPIKEVQIGDRIFGADGKLTTVVSRTDYYDQIQYRITLADRREVICGGGHLWKVIDFNKKEKVITTLDMLKDYQYGKRNDSKYFIPMQAPLEYPAKELPLDPYTLGVLIGDGCLIHCGARFTSADPEILNYIPYKVHKHKAKYEYAVQGIAYHITRLGLREKSELKFIPTIYQYGSIEQRLELLRGLMDTDGSVYGMGQVEFSTSSPQLRNDVKKLLNSLGIRHTILRRKTTHLDSYRFNIITGLPIFKLSRKLNRMNVQNASTFTQANRNKVAVRKIEPIEIAHSICIGVDNQDKLFQVNDNVVTHNSYYVSGAVIGHEWIFNGCKEYIPGEEQIVEIVVGAGEQKYSQDLLGKVKLGLSNLPGGCIIHGKPYPAPFSRNYVGNFEVNKDTQAYRKIQREGIWTEKMGSWIKHRTFQQSPFAASGTRPTWAVMEEAGIFNNLEATFDAMIDTMLNGQTKFGTQLFIGTGGDMDAGTVDASKMFYDPETYNMVVYEDELEHKGKICMFIPTTLGTIDYKDKNGNTDLAKATKIDDEIREGIRRGSNAATALDARKQNQPRYPSEMFLSKSGNIFPRAELQTWLSELEANAHYRQAEDVIELVFDNDGTLKPKLIDSDKAIRKFPHNIKHDDLRGAIVIYEHPIRKGDGTVPFGLYLSGTDPYDHDESGTESLGSTIIYKKISGMGGTQEFPVAEYTGRHERGSDAYYEQARRLILYYGGARNMHENNLIGMYKYFERKNCTHLMLDVPEYAKEVVGSQPNRQKGMHFGPAQIKHGELLIKNWLEEEIAPGRYQLTKLRSIALIKELISYNSKGNFDRVRAFMSIMYALQETYRQQADTISKIKSTNQDPFFSRYDKQKDIISHSKPGFSW